MTEITSPPSSPAVPRPTGRRARRSWPAITGLLALGLLPLLARGLVALAGEGHAEASAGSAFGAPVSALVHVISAVVFVALGAFQFSAGIRRRRRGWHRIAGRVVVIAGLAVALSGLWLAQFDPRPEGTGGLLYVFRLLFGFAMVFSIVRGFRAILRRDVARHRAWMVRAYAIGLGAGTQVFTLGFGGAVFGTGELSEALLHAAGWLINLGVAELVIRRGALRRGEENCPRKIARLYSLRKTPTSR